MRFQRKLRLTQLNRKIINLSLICYNSTCISLKLSISLACLTCEPTICIHTKKSRQQKTLERHKNERNRCDQLWLTKWVTNINSAISKLIRHNEVRAYLGVQSHVVLDFTNTVTTTTQQQIIPARAILSLSLPIVSPVAQIELFSSLAAPPSSLLDEETIRELLQNVLCVMNQLAQNDVAKLNSSATLLNLIDTVLCQIVQN